MQWYEVCVHSIENNDLEDAIHPMILTRFEPQLLVQLVDYFQATRALQGHYLASAWASWQN